MADKKKSDDELIEQIAQLSLVQRVKLKLNSFVGLALLFVFCFGTTYLGSALLVSLVMGKSILETFDVWVNMWDSAWDILRKIIDEFVYDILEISKFRGHILANILVKGMHLWLAR
jgi:hypothetical protein